MDEEAYQLSEYIDGWQEVAGYNSESPFPHVDICSKGQNIGQ